MRGKNQEQLALNLMMLPAVILLLLFSYYPISGILIAFEDFMPAKGWFGSTWVGLDNFKYMINIPGIWKVIGNTLLIAILKIVFGLVVPVTIALLLNEVSSSKFKKSMQTMVYLPHFLSWVILGGIFLDILSPSDGVINKIISLFGGQPIFFLGDAKVFPWTLIATNVWKEFGYGTIVYLAALTGIDSNLYEAAVVDGASKWKQMLHVTLPGMTPIIVLMTVLSLGNVLNAGFDQVFNLYNANVYSTGDIIDTLVYRIGMENAQYNISTAVGLFKSVVSIILITISYKLADKFTGYSVL